MRGMLVRRMWVMWVMWVMAMISQPPRSRLGIYLSYMHLSLVFPSRRLLELGAAVAPPQAGHRHVVHGSYEAAFSVDAQLREVANVGSSIQRGLGLCRPCCRLPKRVLVGNQRFECTEKSHTLVHEVRVPRNYSHARSWSHGHSRSNEWRRLVYGIRVVRCATQDELRGFKALRLRDSTPRRFEDPWFGFGLD